VSLALHKVRLVAECALTITSRRPLDRQLLHHGFVAGHLHITAVCPLEEMGNVQGNPFFLRSEISCGLFNDAVSH